MEKSISRQKIYNAIINERENQGKFHKCLFHLHTCASYDYHLFVANKENFNKIPLNDIEKIFIEKNLVQKNREDDFQKIINNYKIKELNKKELFTYLLIANELIVNDYELVTVTDHNTINGYDYLKNSIDILYQYKKILKDQFRNSAPKIVLGIEISCADKNHVVGMFNDTFATRSKINNFIDEFVMSEFDGTYLTSYDVIDKISEIGGIAYIAHINTSPMLDFSNDEKNFLSKAYKNKLMKSNNLNAVGVNSYDKISSVEKWIKKHTSKEYSYFIDSDSHDIDTIKEKYFWIKGQNINFNMIKEAIVDSNIAIEYSIPEQTSKYIEGICLFNKGNGFLKDSSSNDMFCIKFSDSLNCFIGGRGTGKSTCLNIIEATLAQRFASREVFEAVCSYAQLWLLYKMDDIEYLVNFMPYVPKYGNDSQFENFKKIIKKQIPYAYTLYEDELFNICIDEIQSRIRKDCIHIYKIENNKVNSNEEESSLLDKFFDRAYSVNDLVNRANSKNISDFLKDILYRNEPFLYKKTQYKSLKNIIRNINNIFLKRQNNIKMYLDKFNNDTRINDVVKIVYNALDKNKNFLNFEEVLQGFWSNNSKTKDRYIYKTNITIDGLVAFLSDFERKYGTINMMKIIIDKKLSNNYEIKLSNYTEASNTSFIDKDYHLFTENDEKHILEDVNNFILNKKAGYLLKEFNENYISKNEKISLQFNTMKKEGAEKKENFVDISKLSLGQKVVTMLTFIIGYTDYIQDYCPLIIDQPEDNLDNQYIYKTLVHQLREIKGKRQVIIATHNATIVTNAKADEVIVMKSDGKHGWIEATGYPSDLKIKRKILDYLEGGVESFNHKKFIYKDVLKN